MIFSMKFPGWKVDALYTKPSITWRQRRLFGSESECNKRISQQILSNYVNKILSFVCQTFIVFFLFYWLYLYLFAAVFFSCGCCDRFLFVVVFIFFFFLFGLQSALHCSFFVSLSMFLCHPIRSFCLISCLQCNPLIYRRLHSCQPKIRVPSGWQSAQCS